MTKISKNTLFPALAAVMLFTGTGLSQAHENFRRHQVVEVVFALDTTGSMTGLIEGAKRKIWSIATEMARTGQNTDVRMGLVAYRDLGDAYVTRTYDLTEDINGLYGKLTQFQAAGGDDWPESVNQALDDAVNRMSWTHGSDHHTTRIVFLVGDAPPHMDYHQDRKYHKTMRDARQQGIRVNTIQAGTATDTEKVWRTIAQLGNGSYVAIPQDGNIANIHSPYDKHIHKLQGRLNRTAIPYGSHDQQEDYESKLKTASRAAPSTASDMMSYRAAKGMSDEVMTGVGDLIADIKSGTIELDALKEEEFSPEMRDMSAEERQSFLEKKSVERAEVQAELNDLVTKRDAHISKERKKRASEGNPDSFDLKVQEIIRAQVAAE